MDAFWNLGFVAVKPLEVLLSRDDIALTDILDDQNLFHECKEKNAKLISYLSRPDVLKQLLDFVTDSHDNHALNRAKYQHIATEVLCSDMDAFVDACLQNDSELLKSVWSRVICPTGEPKDTVTISQFCKVFVAFLVRKPHEIFGFMQQESNALSDLLTHIEMPQIADMLLKILLLDREPHNEPVVDWFCDQHLMKQLVQRLSSQNSVKTHQAVLELIKNIILMSSFTPTPGRKEASVLSSNRLSRDLVSPSNAILLISNLFQDKSSPSPIMSSASPGALDSNSSVECSVSSFLTTASTIMELIRKNNSDYFEQYLFLRAREHLIAVQENLQQQEREVPLEPEEFRPALEAAMDEIMSKCGLVNLNILISAICDRLQVLQDRLQTPKSNAEPIPSTVGPNTPLTFERLRICELYGELLHYSNMLLPNRVSGQSPSYDADGQLIGGLDALGDLAEAMMAEADPEAVDSEEEEERPVQESFPVSQNRRRRSFASDSDSEPGSLFNEEVKQESPNESDPNSSAEVATKTSGVSPVSSIENLVDRLSLVATGSPSGRKASLAPGTPPISAAMSKAASVAPHLIESEANSDDSPSTESSTGDKMKTRFLELGVLTTLVDLVFRFPWNNFLHSVVYDILHQVLFGKAEGNLNRELIISLFKDAQLPQRIIDAQIKNDQRPLPQPRLGYMGHLTLMAVDIVASMERYPDDLLKIVQSLLPQPDWYDYVHGSYSETQRTENMVLGGPRPSLSRTQLQTENGWGGDWNDDEDIKGPISPTGEFRRGVSPGKQTADFGLPDDEEDGAFNFNSGTGPGGSGGWGSSSSSDSEDEHEAWLKSSASASQTSHHSRDAENVGFDDAFDDSFKPSFSQTQGGPSIEEDDGFGDFTDARGTALEFTTDFENEDFDFGEFQTGHNDVNAKKDSEAHHETVSAPNSRK